MQRLFVTYFVHDKLNQTAAARQAGFSNPGTAANQLMQSPKIKKAIAEERAEYAKASGVTKQMVIDGLMESISIAKMKADPLAMISGWREVGKMCGHYEPTKVKIEHTMGGRILVQHLAQLTDQQLIELVENDPNILDAEIVDVDPDAESEAS